MEFISFMHSPMYSLSHIRNQKLIVYNSIIKCEIEPNIIIVFEALKHLINIFLYKDSHGRIGITTSKPQAKLLSILILASIYF